MILNLVFEYQVNLAAGSFSENRQPKYAGLVEV